MKDQSLENNHKLRIAIFSSASQEIEQQNISLSDQIGELLAKHDVTVVTGGSTGIPARVVESAKEHGGKTIMFSPDSDHTTHQERHDNHSMDFYDSIFFGEGFTERSLRMIQNIDGAIVLNGRTGTLSEFTIAVEEGVPVAVITGTGGISDHLSHILDIIDKEFPEEVFFGNDYQEQIRKLISHLEPQSM
ncbi:hypothetical protein H6776_02045 [Candidatus Nomurabacteria bacterium]|nr:hypothetical protein [Candidatus Nomurabacteria bacterium]